MALALLGCGGDEVRTESNVATNPERTPTVRSIDVQTVISDSGNTRYRITTRRWDMYEQAKRPHWIFPKGVVAEELDKKPPFRTITAVRCDSAYYDEQLQRWDLRGNVKITNADGSLLNTDQMFWDQKTQEIYSEAFIRLQKDGRIIEGYGYRSDQRLTTYTLRRVQAIIPVDPQKLPTQY